MASLADGELAVGARAQGNLAARLVLGGLERVAQDVQQGLNQLRAIAEDVGQAGVVVAPQQQAIAHLGEYQLQHMLDHLVNIQRGQGGLFIRAEQAVDQAAQAIGLLDNDAGVLAQRPLGQFPLQQLRRAADTAKGIFDFVGQAAHDRARGLLGIEQVFFATDAQQAIHRL